MRHSQLSVVRLTSIRPMALRITMVRERLATDCSVGLRLFHRLTYRFGYFYFFLPLLAAAHPLSIVQGSTNVSSAQMLQNQINVAAAMQQQQQSQQKMLHNALTRTASHQPNSTEMLTWVMENMNAGQHRKLERTQSEPAPQVNTSRCAK